MILMVHTIGQITQNFSLVTARRVLFAVVGATACDIFEQGFYGPDPVMNSESDLFSQSDDRSLTLHTWIAYINCIHGLHIWIADVLWET